MFKYCVEAFPFSDILLLNGKTFNALCQLGLFFLGGGGGTAHGIGVHTVTKCKLKGVSVTHVHDVFNLYVNGEQKRPAFNVSETQWKSWTALRHSCMSNRTVCLRFC